MKNYIADQEHIIKYKEAIKYKIICITIGVALALIILELILRFLGFGYNLIYRLPQDRGAGYRIFCVGESTTFGIGTSNPILQGYPHQLEEMLNSKFNLKTQCFFDQTIGQNTSDILEKLIFNLKKYQPDLVIFMVGANNWWNLNKSNILLFNRNKFISESTLKTLIFLDNFRTWKLFKWIGYSNGFINYISDTIPIPYEPGNIKKYSEKLEKDAEKTHHLIEEKYGLDNHYIFNKIAEHDISEMIKICKVNNIRIIICSYPLGGDMELRLIHKNLSKKFEVPFVDNYIIFEALPNKKDYLSFAYHPNEKGYKLIAENIYNCITENKL